MFVIRTVVYSIAIMCLHLACMYSCIPIIMYIFRVIHIRNSLPDTVVLLRHPNKYLNQDLKM